MFERVEAQKYYRQGLMLGSNDIRGEIKKFTEAIKIDPNYKDPYKKLITLYSKLGQYDNEIYIYKLVISRWPEISEYFNDIGLIYMKLNNYYLAKKFFKQALNIDRKNNGFSNSVYVNNLSNAQNHLNSIQRNNHYKAKYYYKLGDKLQYNGKKNKSVRIYNKSIHYYKALVPNLKREDKARCYYKLAKIFDQIIDVKEFNLLDDNNINLNDINYNNSIYYYKESLLFTNSNQLKRECYQHLGNLMNNQSNLNDKVNDYKQAFNFSRSNQGKAYLLTKVACTYLSLGNIPKAIMDLKTNFKFTKDYHLNNDYNIIKEAITYFKRAFSYTSPTQLPFMFMKLLSLYLLCTKYNDVIHGGQMILQNATNYYRSDDNNYCEYYLVVAVAELKIHHVHKALKYSKSGLTLALKLKAYGIVSFTLVDDIIGTLKNMVNLCHKIQPHDDYIDYQDSLSQLVGLRGVKKDLRKYVARYEIQTLKNTNDSQTHSQMHLVLEGAPGVGKTTVAKLFSKILAQKHIIKPNNFSVINAASLSGQYYGDAVKKMKKAVIKAINGVLFIDEAYALNPSNGNSDVENAVSVLLTEMDKHKDDMVVILAGYTKAMTKLFNEGNPGFRSRFPDIIKFPNYTNAECFKIFMNDLNNKKMVLDQRNDTVSLLKKSFNNYITLEKNEKGDKFDNARLVKNVCSKLIDNAYDRMIREYHGKLNVVKENNPKALNIITTKDIFKTFDKGRHSVSKHNYLNDLNQLIGLKNVKQQIKTYINEAKVNRVVFNNPTHDNLNMIFEGAPGTGKTTVAKLLCKILVQEGISQSDNYVTENANKLVSKYQGESAENVRKDVRQAMGGVLFIDEAYALGNKNSGMRSAVEELLTCAEDYNNELIIILAGYPEQMEKLRNYVNPGFKSRFPKVIKFQSYTPDECYQILKLYIRKNGFTLATSQDESALKHDFQQFISMKQSEDQGDFANARVVRNLYQSLKGAFSNRIGSYSLNKIRELKANNNLEKITRTDIEATFKKFGVTNQPKYSRNNKYIDQLNSLIGLTGAKKQIKDYVRSAKINRVLGIHNNSGIDLVFEGAPGTGKTTVARLFAHILYNIGAVKAPKVRVVQHGSDLMGEYIGQTETKARRIIHSALGGVLFIDEAYTLALTPNGDGNNDYKEEALAELVTASENHRHDLAIILAGYVPQMNYFFDHSNPGLDSRFNTKIVFNSYTNQECLQILELMLKNNKLILAGTSTKEMLTKAFLKAVTHERAVKKSRFGNGRYVRNVADKLSAARKYRLARLPMDNLLLIRKTDPKKLYTITSADIKRVFNKG